MKVDLSEHQPEHARRLFGKDANAKRTLAQFSKDEIELAKRHVQTLPQEVRDRLDATGQGSHPATVRRFIGEAKEAERRAEIEHREAVRAGRK